MRWAAEKRRPFAASLFGLGLMCCVGGTTSTERRVEAQESPASPPPSAPAARPLEVVPVPLISPFTPELVTRLRALGAGRTNRQNDVFMKVGDSSTVSRGFLGCLADAAEVDLDGRTGLQTTLNHFRRGRAGGRNPFRRQSLAAREGWSTRQVLAGSPSPLLQELRAARPRFALVMNGGNDVEGEDDYVFGQRLMRIVDALTAQGVLPVLSSASPRREAAANRWVRRYNQVSWAVAHAMRVPYLDYYQAFAELPRLGLAGDGVHPNIFIERGQSHACRFDEEGLRYGHNARNLVALRGLDLLRRTVVEGEAAPARSEAPPAGEGTLDAPREVTALPFAELRDTRTEGSSRIDRYPGCGAEQDEGGRELVYRLTVAAPLRVRAVAMGRSGTDVDVHLLRGTPSGEACVARADREVEHELTPGTWFVAVDTFRNDGEAAAGPVLVLIAPSDGPPTRSD